MTKSEGVCRIDSVEMGEVSINRFTGQLSAKYVLRVSKTSEGFGAGNRNQGWSEETMTKLEELMQSMERDVCADLFDEAATSAGVEVTEASTSDGVPGL